MGTYDGVEVFDLLYKLSLKYNKNSIGLYRDDGLTNISGPKSENVKKDIQKLFKENELHIVIQCNMKTVNYFDVTLNLENSIYRPYKKENIQIKYINTESNHPPYIITQLAIPIESLLLSLSSSEEILNNSVTPYQSSTTRLPHTNLQQLGYSIPIFNNSVTPYQDALYKSGYKHKLKYQTNINTVNNKNNQKINIWFNPPYNKNVKTNIGKTFLTLIKKHFTPHHKFHNKNTMTISYNCTRNIKTILNSRNAKILFPKKSTERRTCNCLNKDTCPLE